MPGQSDQRITPSQEEDRRLLSQSAAGDRRAAEQFVLRFSDLIYRCIQQTLIVKHISFTKEDLKDFHHSVFAELFDNQCKKLRQYEGRNGCSVASWIRTITIRIILNLLRKKRVDSIEAGRRRISIDELFDLKDESPQAEELLENFELESRFQEAVQTLAPRDRLLMKLHIEHGLSLPEVAETMSISVQNAYTIKHRLIQRLKKALGVTC